MSSVTDRLKNNFKDFKGNIRLHLIVSLLNANSKHLIAKYLENFRRWVPSEKNFLLLIETWKMKTFTTTIPKFSLSTFLIEEIVFENFFPMQCKKVMKAQQLFAKLPE